MDTAPSHDDKDTETTYSDMRWYDIRQFQHRYLINIPNKVDKNIKYERKFSNSQFIEQPYPLFYPVRVVEYDKCKKLFTSKPKLNRRLEYYKKLYSKENHKVLLKQSKYGKFVVLPQYIVDVAEGSFEDCDDCVWHYTGGTLDCFSFNGDTYIARVGLGQSAQVIDVNMHNRSVNLNLGECAPAYGLKTMSQDDCVLLALRQKRNVSVFKLFCDGRSLRELPVWKNMSNTFPYVDMVFSEFTNTDLSTIDEVHKLKVTDFSNKKVKLHYDFPVQSDTSTDNFAQIEYLNCNTVCFINRCCIYLLDLRSLTTKKTCLNTTWLKCDDLCTISKSKRDPNCISVSSTHNFINFDVRSERCSRMLHMLSTPPFMSSSVVSEEEEYVCLFGQHINDRVLLHTSKTSTIPRYIPNTLDTLTSASLTKSLNICRDLEKRLSLPALGMKLHIDNATDDINLFTLSAAGDVFKQRILKDKSLASDVTDILTHWTESVHYTPKPLEATSICNLNNVMHSISSRFPQEQKLKALMKENSSQKLFNKEFAGLTKYLEGSVGQAMNAIWGDESVVEGDDTVLPPSMSPSHRVSEWLHSNVM